MALALLGALALSMNALSMSEDLVHVPFSRFGSWLALTADPASRSIVVHDAHHDFGRDRIATIQVEGDGAAWPVVNHASYVATRGDRVALWLVDDHTLGLEARDASVRVEPIGAVAGTVSRRVRTLEFWTGPSETRQSAILKVLAGTQATDGWIRADADGRVALALRIGPRPSARLPKLDREKQIERSEQAWQAFLAKLPPVAASHTRQARAAWYNLWAAGMRKQGPWTWDAILMSKATMTWVWSWDHCFTALALGRTDMDLAMDQFLQPFPLMNDEGCLPDMWKAPNLIGWYATKPPIHGWALSKLMDMGEVPRSRLAQAYGYLARWTEFWFRRRDPDGDGIPSYRTSGNDSGWDNSTLFANGADLESPELSAYLVLQMRSLARVAATLGKKREARDWNRRGDELKSRLIEHSWVGDRFVAKRTGSHEYDAQPTSMLPLMAIAMGDELDSARMDRLVDALRPFLTENGPCTELPDSPHYRSDGYWRGPIWAPTTYLLCDGLRRAGRGELAREIARRFATMIAEKAGGNYENFDALTGQGLCAPGYTWTSAVHLLLLKEYLDFGSNDR